MAIQKQPRTGLPVYTAGTDPHPNRQQFNERMILLETVIGVAVQGTLAERPAPGVPRRLFCTTEAPYRMYWDTGTAWREITVNGGGGPGAPILTSGTASEGTSDRSARADHTHVLSNATSSVDGSMSALDKAKLDGATSSSTASRLMQRDPSGRAQVTNPSAGADIANKAYVDGKGSSAPASSVVGGTGNASGTSSEFSRADHVHALPLATGTTAGALSGPDKATLDAATHLPTANTLAQRDGSGRLQAVDPVAEKDVANKDYVDRIGTQAAAGVHTHSANDTTSGVFNPARLPLVTATLQGALSPQDKVKLDGIAASTSTPQGVTVGGTSSTGASSTYARADHTHALPLATTSADGAMSNEDKAKLNGISASSSAPAAVTAGGTASAGSSSAYARADHAHVIPLATSSTSGAMGNGDKSKLDGIALSNNAPGAVVVGGSSAAGTSGGYARADHTHGLILATRTTNGAMTSTDKAALDDSTANATGGTLVRRTSAGQALWGAPTSSGHTATKGYVDGQLDPVADLAGRRTVPYEGFGTIVGPGLRGTSGDPEFIATINIEDPGWPYRVQATAAIPLTETSGSRWDMDLMWLGAVMDLALGREYTQPGEQRRVTGLGLLTVTGPSQVQLRVRRVAGTSGGFDIASGGGRMFRAWAVPE